jgi:Spy/CpxP family protein refolding chaperone
MLLKLALPLALTSVGGFSAMHGPACIAKRLGITDAQKASFHASVEAHKPALMAKAKTFCDARGALMDAGMDPAVATESLEPLKAQVSETSFELMKEVRAVYLEVLPQLTDEQRAKGRAALQEFHVHVGEKKAQHAEHHAMMARFLSHRLELSEAQQQRLQAIHEAHQPTLQARFQALHAVMKPALEAALDPQTSEAALRAQHQQVMSAVFAVGTEIRSTYLEALPVLTEAQRGQLKNLVTQVRTHVEGLRKALLGF